MSTSIVEQVAPEVPRDDAFRRRLLDGLAATIEERGYRESTVADIVRHALVDQVDAHAVIGRHEGDGH